MRTLYHFPLCPFSRKIRLTLLEKKLDFSLENHHFWENNPTFRDLNPSGQIPVFIDLNGSVFSDSVAIFEYLEECYPDVPLLPQKPEEKAETRRLVAWFDQILGLEVTLPLLYEKVIKLYSAHVSSPNSNLIRLAKQKLKRHFDYIEWLVDRRKWLGGIDMTIADLTAASQLSVLDYLGDLPWEDYQGTRDWYAKIKSRPSFRSLLMDRAQKVRPSPHYANLDF